MRSGIELVVLEERLALLIQPTGVAAYDFDSRLHFECAHPYRIDSQIDSTLRIGAPVDYDARYHEAVAFGLRPANNPEQHLLASEIERWYPLITGLTPKTRVFDALPDADSVENEIRMAGISETVPANQQAQP